MCGGDTLATGWTSHMKTSGTIRSTSRPRCGARHLVRSPLPRHRRHPALCGALPFCVARSSELGRMAQGGGHSLDPATAAAFPRRGALRLPPLPARRIGGLLRPKAPRKRMPHYLYLCASADGGADGDVRSLLAKARRVGLVRHSLPGGSGRQPVGAGPC